MTELACFGFVTCFDGESDTCCSCEKVKSCQRQCHEALSSIDTGIGETPLLLRRHQRWAVKFDNPSVSLSQPVRENYQTPKTDVRVKGMSKTASDIARAMIHSYINLNRVTSEIAMTVNPVYLSVMLTEFVTGKVVTRTIKDELQARLAWRESTAKSYASGFIEVLVMWGVVSRVKRGVYEVKV